MNCSVLLLSYANKHGGDQLLTHTCSALTVEYYKFQFIIQINMSHDNYKYYDQSANQALKNTLLFFKHI